VLRPKERYSAKARAQILRAYREGMSLRGWQRGFGMWRMPVLRWLAHQVATLPPLSQTRVPAQADAGLEMDEWVPL
jgi:hypothetical protein